MLYLPFHCSFRMTDIWRGMLAQRLAWENGWSVAFTHATVRQERNPHDLMDDFTAELPGYLHNERLRGELEDLPLSGRRENLLSDLERAYEVLIRLELVGAAERPLLSAWRADMEAVLSDGTPAAQSR